MEAYFTLLQTTRQNFLHLLEKLDTDTLNRIPAGFNNNLAWHLGHLVVTPQLLLYRLSGLETQASERLIEQFRKGTKPAEPLEAAIIEKLKQSFADFPARLKSDSVRGLFLEFSPYETSYGFGLSSFEDALLFNNIHEGVHYGYALSLKRALGA
ncbi:MAG: DinB family protein [Microscillaceae bacterium]